MTNQHQDLEIVVNADNSNNKNDGFAWTTGTVLQALVLFCFAGIAEILGGWLVWKAVRGNADNHSSTSNQPLQQIRHRSPWWYAVLGSLVLILYGFIPCFQPSNSFGRIYAAYGGFFIVLSFLFGWALDGDRPDIGDVVGGLIAMGGVCVIMFWPRG